MGKEKNKEISPLPNRLPMTSSPHPGSSKAGSKHILFFPLYASYCLSSSLDDNRKELLRRVQIREGTVYTTFLY